MDEYGWGINGATFERVANSDVFQAHSGTFSWKFKFLGLDVHDAGTAIKAQVNPWHFALDPDKNDRFIFYMYACPGDDSDTPVKPDIPEIPKYNNVCVEFFDQNLYKSSGFKVWTTQTASYEQWTELHVLYSQLPPDFDLNDVDKVQFLNYWPGTYFIDDISSFRGDRVYQSFEPDQRAGSPASEYGWRWNDEDVVDFSADGEPVQEGLHSWKLVTPFNWSGTGIQSQEKRYLNNNGSIEQSFWHVDLEPGLNDRLTLWAYALPENGMDNNMAVQFYDHGAHFTDNTKDVAWTSQVARYGRWTRLTVPLSAVSSDFNLRDINKLQFQHYWPGTYFIDDIRAGTAPPVFDKTALAGGKLQWDALPDANYILQESTDGPEGPWHEYWSSTGKDSWQSELPLRIRRLVKTWYRARWVEGETNDNNLPYSSDWSGIAEYNPSLILIDSERLNAQPVQVLQWTNIDFADGFEVETLVPLSLIYDGPYPENGLGVTPGVRYRVRAYRYLDAGGTKEFSAWSAPQKYDPGKGFIRAQGTVLKEDDGNGEEIVLRGVNLGNYLLNEPWMTGIGTGDTPNIEDEWTLRNELTRRFGAQGCEDLLHTFRGAYLQDIDFDNLSRLGMNFVRLPIYYRVLQDEAGNWLGDAAFAPIDRIVQSCAQRGIYVLLDLHGAPGSQSNEFHTGRVNYNKLFEETEEGENYRIQTVELWKKIAAHYADNPAVMGYDLLNEPVGAPAPQALWDMYDRIYRAIREIDTNHIMVMEGIWLWDTLPDPKNLGWENVAYQFHYYLWDRDDDVQAHREYIDRLVGESDIKQAEYQVPVMIGEFTGFSQRAIWEYYLANFNRRNYSWAFWSYKTHAPHSNWALYTHTGYSGDLPKIRAEQPDGSAGDSFETLRDKFLLYDTIEHHEENFSLAQILAKFMVHTENRPFIKNITPDTGLPGFECVINGENFGGAQGTVFFSGDTLGSEVLSWSDTAIHLKFPADERRKFGFVVVQTDNGTSNVMPVRIVVNMPPVLDPVGNPSVPEGQALSFAVNAADPENDPLTYTASSLPQGAVFTGNIFTWTPAFNQAGSYKITFTVSDGHFSDKETITITVRDVSLTIGGLSDSPDPFSPNKDSRKDTTVINGSFDHSAVWTLKIKNRFNTFVRTFQGSGTSVGVVWDGRNSSGVYAGNGTYTYTLSGSDAGGNTASWSGTVTVDKTAPVLSRLKDAPDPFWPTRYPTNISFTLSEPCYVTVRVYSGSKPIRTLITNTLLPAGRNSLQWNGKKDSGAYVSRGVYTYYLWVEDKAANRTAHYPLKGRVTSY